MQQINLSYNPKHDRLLMKVAGKDNAEYRIWLTRRYTGLLMAVLQERMAGQGNVTMQASESGLGEQIKAGAFSTPYQAPQSIHFPLGEDGCLAYRINAQDTREGRLRLQLLPEEGEGISLVLDKPMLYMIHNLLEQSLTKTGWNLPNSRPPASTLH